MKRWVPLLFLALLFAGAAAFLSMRPGREDAARAGLWLPGYDPEQVTELQLYGPAGEDVLLRKAEDRWGVAAQHGYPADEERLYDLLLSLSELRREESRTARPENHALLGLTAPGEEGAEALRFVLRGASGTLGDFLLGKNASSREGVYLRRTEEAQTWLATPALEKPPLDPWLWLQQPLLAIEDKDLQELRFTVEGAEYRLQNLDGKLQPAPDSGWALIEGESLPDYKLSLQSMHFEEVRPRDDEDLPAGARTYQAEVLCCEGMRIVMEFTALEQGGRLRLSASGAEDIADRIQSFNRRHESWAYQMEGKIVEMFDFSPDDYLEPAPVAPPKTDKDEGDKDKDKSKVPQVELRP